VSEKIHICSSLSKMFGRNHPVLHIRTYRY